MDSAGRIKILRNKLGLNQDDFGKELGITKSSVSRLESNVSGLSERMAKSICSTFNVNYFWLTEGQGEADRTF